MTFDVSDDCNALRINDKIFHRYSGAYVVDTYPSGTSSLSSPVFNEDFSLAVTNTGIYNYTAKTSSVDGKYNLDRADTFEGDKFIWKDGNNYVIATHKAGTGSLYTYKVQFNTIVNKTSVKIAEFTGTVTNKPIFLVSPKLTKFVLNGLSESSSTTAFYLAKTIDYGLKVVKDITLPNAVKSIIADIDLTDEFLHVFNKNGDKKQTVYTIHGTTLI